VTFYSDLLLAACKAPLPGGLKVLDFEIEFLPVRSSMGDQFDDCVEDFRRLFGHLGIANIIEVCGVEASIFGTDSEALNEEKEKRVRLSLILPEAMLVKWFGEGGRRGFSKLPLKTDCYHKIIHTRTSDSLADHFDREGWWNYDVLFKGLEFPDLEWVEECFLASAVTEADLNRFHDLGEIANWSVRSMAEALRRSASKAPSNSFLVPGLIPDGVPTLLLGNKKTGKSTALLELCLAVANREPEWAGFPICHDRRGFAVYICGEDSPAEVLSRVRRMTGGGETPFGLNIVPARGTDLDNILKQLDRENVRLLAIDPARKFFNGDEDSSDLVSGLFNRIEALAAKKNCATVLTHHLKRGSMARTVAEVGEQVRGSGVWLERPRVVLGMARPGAGETHFGISGPPDAPLHNFEASMMFSGVRRLRRDDATSRHIPVEGAGSSISKQALTPEEKETALSAAKSTLMNSGRITRTGPNELYKQAPPQN
jgi:AAA domain